jgi:hypothetical protein
MSLNPEWIVAICAGITLLILWTSTVIGGAVWLMSKLGGLERRILADFQTKHDENNRKVAALETLVIRHDTILDPEFNGSGIAARRAKT